MLAKLWRGSPIIRPLSTLIDSGISWIDVTPHLAKRAGRVLADAGVGPGAVDALVATVAATFGDIVLTPDPDDFARLTQHFAGLRVLAV